MINSYFLSLFVLVHRALHTERKKSNRVLELIKMAAIEKVRVLVVGDAGNFINFNQKHILYCHVCIWPTTKKICVTLFGSLSDGNNTERAGWPCFVPRFKTKLTDWMTLFGSVHVFIFSGVGKTSLVHLICHNEPITNPYWTIGGTVEVKVCISTDTKYCYHSTLLIISLMTVVCLSL